MSQLTWKKWPLPARFAGCGPVFILCLGIAVPGAGAWTIWDLNPWKQLRESRIFSLTRSNPIGVRIMIVPVIDEPVNAPIYTRLGGEFANSLRSFANEVWLVTDLPNNPVKRGFYEALPRILADYRMRNRLSMALLHQMMPDFECDYIALFEVTDYDRFWVDEDLQHRVGVRAVFYDYEDGEPRLEKYAEGGRGRRLEEGAFSEAERMAIKTLVCELERPLRTSVLARECELQRRYNEMSVLASVTGAQELAVHKYDLALMKQRIAEAESSAWKAETESKQTATEREYWKEQAEKNQSLLEDAKKEKTQATAPSSGVKSGLLQDRTERAAVPVPIAAQPSGGPAASKARAEPLSGYAPSPGRELLKPPRIDFDSVLGNQRDGDWEYADMEVGEAMPIELQTQPGVIRLK